MIDAVVGGNLGRVQNSCGEPSFYNTTVVLACQHPSAIPFGILCALNVTMVARYNTPNVLRYCHHFSNKYPTWEDFRTIMPGPREFVVSDTSWNKEYYTPNANLHARM